MKLDDAYKVFAEIKSSISKLEDRWGHLPEEFEFDYDNPDEKFKHDIARSVTDKLGDIQSILAWLDKPVIAEGTLTKNENDRYELNGIELSSGYALDAWDAEFNQWDYSRVEHNGEDYHITSLAEIKRLMVSLLD